MNFLTFLFTLLLVASPVLALNLRLRTATGPSAETVSFSICSTCKSATSVIKSVITGSTATTAISFLVRTLCRLGYTTDICEIIDASYFQPMFAHMMSRFLQPNVTCARLGLCPQPSLVVDSDEDFARRVLAKKPPPVSVAKSSGSGKKLRFVVFTDIHVDYKYLEGANTECSGVLCCRKDSEGSFFGSSGKKSGKWGSLASCDIPLRTLQSFLNFTTERLRPDFFVWLGDNRDSDTFEVDKENHTKAAETITQTLVGSGYDSAGKVYPAIGNHEGLPCDQFDLRTGKHQWVLDSFTQMWSPWLNTESQRTLRTTGSYSQLHPGTSLRIISLFPIVSDTINAFIWENATNPWGVLTWLEAQLAYSEEHNESALILNHFPSNSYFMNKHWGFRYKTLIDR